MPPTGSPELAFDLGRGKLTRGEGHAGEGGHRAGRKKSPSNRRGGSLPFATAHRFRQGAIERESRRHAGHRVPRRLAYFFFLESSSSVFTFFFFFSEILTTRTLGMPKRESPSLQRSCSTSFASRSVRVRTFRDLTIPAFTFRLLSIVIVYSSG